MGPRIHRRGHMYLDYSRDNECRRLIGSGGQERSPSRTDRAQSYCFMSRLLRERSPRRYIEIRAGNPNQRYSIEPALCLVTKTSPQPQERQVSKASWVTPQRKTYWALSRLWMSPACDLTASRWPLH
jgi:hypothetical protein